ncbi:hypothetical protein Q5Y75_26605 [Ruegeria sp. 2205SS24-7]|uniref:hypothetical protein n=1 Tax=Ruegeria discodermiae TaxID=3064389 RepID=UPI002741DA8D|nr:hypothetical protein [Ruegeria sp. 2205SS24-7]MDP5220764.1 hypothetical protein [Ruegeria sp. 2205SS24-7]
MAEKLSAEELSKDRYFEKLAGISAEMIDEHGKDFAMGALVLAAQWIARGETKPPTAPVEH